MKRGILLRHLRRHGCYLSAKDRLTRFGVILARVLSRLFRDTPRSQTDFRRRYAAVSPFQKDMAAALERLKKARGQRFKGLVNEALRRGLREMAEPRNGVNHFAHGPWRLAVAASAASTTWPKRWQ